MGEESKVKEINSMEAFKTELQSDKLVVVDAFATWCPPCRYLSPYFVKFSNTFENATFLKVDVDKGKDIAKLLNIEAMPTIKFFKGGKEIAEVVGAHVENIEKKIKELY